MAPRPRATSPAETPAPASDATRLNAQELEKFLVNFVVEQTGYPAEIVELDADLEADLGIDSIKKAQLFGELGEYFEVQPSEELSLDDFPTLRHVLAFLLKSQGSGASSTSQEVSTGQIAASPAKPVAKPAAPAATHALASSNGEHKPSVSTADSPKLDAAELEKFLVNFVVEQTGYPAEIVELDADLEADLGIDSIKKAQLFGELGEYFEVQPSEDLSLDDFPTLRHVLAFLLKSQGSGASATSQGASAGAAAPARLSAAKPAEPAAARTHASTNGEHKPSASTADSPKLDAAELEKFLVNFVVEQTGYPAEIVELDADLEADLGIDSIKKAQLFGELGEYFEVQPSEDLSLDDFPTLRHVLAFLLKSQGSAQAPATGRVASATPAVEATRPAATPAAAPRASHAKTNGEHTPASAAEAPRLDAQELEKFLVNFVVEQTGYPAEIVELDADLEADLGIDSIKKAQLFGELGEYFEVQPSEDLSLDDFPTLRHVLAFLLKSQGTGAASAR
jgi:acyl carrier protein